MNFKQHSVIANWRKHLPLMLAFLLMTVAFIYLIKMGALFLQADSNDYIFKHIIRSPVYPLIIDVFSLIGGKGNYMPLIIFQILFGFFTCFLICKTIERIFKINEWVFLFLLALYLLPYLIVVEVNGSSGGQGVGNHILSEGIAYPLFLLAARSLLMGLLEKKDSSLFLFILYTSLLILTRKQYFFLYGIIIVLLGYFFLFRKDFSKKGLLIISLMGAIAVPNLLEKTYHYAYHGLFETSSYSGMMFAVSPLYLSKPTDSSLFKDPLQEKVFSEFHQMLPLKVPPLEWQEIFPADCLHLYIYYNHILSRVLHSVLEKNIKGPDVNTTNIQLQKMQRFALSLAVPLIKAHWLEYLSLYIRGIIMLMGGYYLFALTFFAFVTALFVHLKYHDKASLALFFAILINYGNYFSIALLVMPQSRYTFSTTIFMVSMFIVGLSIFSKNIKKVSFG